MPRHDALVYRLRRFRVAMLAAVAFPWVIDVLLAPFFGWYGSALRAAIFLVIDALLVFFAWRRPAGIAAIVIIVRLCLGAVVFLKWGNDVGHVYGVVLGAGAILLVALLVPMWLPLRRERRRAQLARVDAMTSRPDRKALKRRAKIEKQGYL
jgi:hypothetical protein